MAPLPPAGAHVTAPACTQFVPQPGLSQQNLQPLGQLGGVAARHHRSPQQAALAAGKPRLELRTGPRQ